MNQFKTPQIGELAPNFLSVSVYKNHLGKIRLSDYRGKKYVILIFYAANFIPLSSIELIAFSDKINDFRKLSTQVLAISIDSPFSHLRNLLSSREEGGLYNLNYPLISDLNRKIVKSFNVLNNEGFPIPSLFIIDKEGLIQYYEFNNVLCGRNINEIIRLLKTIQYIKNNPGQSCPAHWILKGMVLYSHPLKSKNYFKELYSSKKL